VIITIYGHISLDSTPLGATPEEAAMIAGEASGVAVLHSRGGEEEAMASAALSAEGLGGSSRAIKEALLRVERFMDGIRKFRHDPREPSAGSSVADSNLRMMFNFIDKDESGTVSRQELALALRRDPNVQRYFGLPASYAKGSREHDEFEAVFTRLDSDSSHGVTWQEFQKLTRIDPKLKKAATEHLKKRAFEKRAKKAKKKKRLGVEAFGAVLSHEQVGGSPLLPDPHDHCTLHLLLYGWRSRVLLMRRPVLPPS